MTTAAPGRGESPVRRRRIAYLITLRRRAGWSQQTLADLSGVSQSTISRLELARPARTIDPAIARRLAVALGHVPALLRFGPDPAVVAAIRARRRRRALRSTGGPHAGR